MTALYRAVEMESYLKQEKPKFKAEVGYHYYAFIDYTVKINKVQLFACEGNLNSFYCIVWESFK